jgi:hypothetical protein
MAREIPEVVRAAAGLAATVLDEARKLPETLPGLPVRVIGLAMQHAMKVQQQYAGLVARGDELFTGLRGEDEPGLATFDDDEPDAGGFRESAFDRAADSVTSANGHIDDAEVQTLPADPPADAVTAAVDEMADQVEDGRQSIEELVEEAPEIEEILDEIAIDELVDQAPTLDETAPTTPAADEVAPTDAADGAEPTVDVATTVDVLTPDGGVEAVDALVTDESGSPVALATGTPDAPAGGGDTSVPQVAPTAPIEGYDDFSIAQLRGRLRGYQLTTVEELIAYERANRAREPYLRMLRNRLEKLEQQAVESSPLAPRG